MIIRPRIFSADQCIEAGFTTRGFRDGAFEQSLQRIKQETGFSLLATAEQVHGGNVEIVKSQGLQSRCDGLVTRTPDLLLAVRSADCALVLLSDEQNRVIGACHSGWRGTVANVAGHTVEAMLQEGAYPKLIRAYISPCISAKNFEVGEEVAVQFEEQFVSRLRGQPRPFVDLKAAIEAQLAACGLRQMHIETSQACTVEDAARFYSYRRESGTKGRMIGFIGLNNV